MAASSENQEIPDSAAPSRRALAGRPVHQDIGPWRVLFKWPDDVDQGGPWSVMVMPGPDATERDIAGGVSSTVLRRIDFQSAADEWRSRRADRDRSQERQMDGWSQHLRTAVADGITDRYLATLSRVYVELVTRGSGSVTAKLGELAGKQPETIRAHLKDARKRELLTTVKGRAGGRLTMKAREILGMPIMGTVVRSEPDKES